MTTPAEQDPWELYQPAYPGILTGVSDVDNAMFVVVPEDSEENPFDEGPLDTDGLTDDEFDMIFRRPADEVPVALLASAWAGGIEVDTPLATQAQEELQSTMDPDLKRYWLRGEGAAKIRWGTPGAFKRCVSNLREHFPQATEGLCANLYHEATGHWPGEDRGKK
jgi:hypothetical protein